MHEQAQLCLKQDEVAKLGAAVYVVLPHNVLRTKVFKTENRFLSTRESPFSEEKTIVCSTALSDPAGRAAAIYGVSRKCIRWRGWVENQPCWFVIDRKGTLTYVAQPTFSTPTSYVDDIDDMLEALKKASQ